MPKYLLHHLSHVSHHRRGRHEHAAGTVEFPPLPTKPPEMPWRDYLIMLLHVGAELEHGLMVQYLYAAYSLGGDNVPPEDQDKVREWQELILTVAREEMGHLLTVQNLLCFVGGPVSFNREEFPWDTPFYPFPFMLEPLSLESLAAYVFAEMPGNFDTLEKIYAGSAKGSLDEYFEHVGIPFIEKTVKKWVRNRGAHPVGEVYKLITDIIKDPKKIPDSDFRPDSYPLQASWDDWGRSYAARPTMPDGTSPKQDPNKAHIIIEQVGTRTDAIRALQEISNQGEAADLKPKTFKLTVTEEPGDELSHFARFKEIFEEFEKKSEKPGWNPVRKVPRNPTTNTDPEADPRRARGFLTPITAKASLLWANLSNVRYRLLLTYLTHTFRLARVVAPDEPNVRGAMMAKIFGEMYNLKAISGILVRMPLTDKAGDERRAGPPFEMPYTIDLPLDETDCWRLHKDLVMTSKNLCETLLDPEKNHLATTPPEGKDYLLTLRSLDQKAMAWIDTVLTGLRGHGGKRS